MQHTDRKHKPVATTPDFDEFPDELRPLKQWVLWKYIWRDDAWTKCPLTTTGEPASSTDPETWSELNTVIAAFNGRQGYFDGVGFVFTRESGYVGIDVDNCVEWIEQDGLRFPQFNDWLQHTLAKIGETYVEYSPSKTGAHIIVKANPKQAIKYSEGGFEIYAEGRYFTFTGNGIDSSPIEDRTDQVNEIVEKILQLRAGNYESNEGSAKKIPACYLNIEQRLEIALNHASNSAALKKLFEGDYSDYSFEIGGATNEGRSEADMALCRLLAFYSEGNPALLIEMMMRSKMVRSKWSKVYGDGSTYLSRLVKTVLATEKNFYEAPKSLLNSGTGTPQAKLGGERSNRVYEMVALGELALKTRSDPGQKGLRAGGCYHQLDDIFRPRRKLLTVTVGDPGSGKTTLILNYLYYLCKAHKLYAGLCSFENDPADLTHAMVQAHLQRPTYPEFDGCCSDQEFLDALAECGQWFRIYTPAWEETNVQAISNYWEDSIANNRLDIVYLDPFSNLQPSAQLIGKYTDFANEQLAYFWHYIQTRSLMGFLLCHPTKNYDRTKGPPRLSNINGSGAFDRCADFGIGIDRIEGKLRVQLQKVRHWRTGSMGEEVAFYYDRLTGVYTPAQPTFTRKRSSPGKKSYSPF